MKPEEVKRLTDKTSERINQVDSEIKDLLIEVDLELYNEIEEGWR